MSETSNQNEINLDVDSDSFDSWYQEEKVADAIPEMEDAESVDTDDAETKNSRSWFNSVFTDEDSPDAMDSEMSDEMYSFSSDATTEVTDMLFANLNSKLHGEDVNTHTADEHNRQKVKRAWELYLRWKKTYVTPSWYLALTLFLTYGMGTLTGLYKWYKRYIKMGWSKAWNTVSGAWAGDAELEDEHHSAEHHKAVRKAREMDNVITARDIADEDVPTRSKSVKPIATTSNGTETCLLSGAKFTLGDGVPKTSKSNPELIGKFSSMSNYTKYKHENGMMNYRGNGKK